LGWSNSGNPRDVQRDPPRLVAGHPLHHLGHHFHAERNAAFRSKLKPHKVGLNTRISRCSLSQSAVAKRRHDRAITRTRIGQLGANPIGAGALKCRLVVRATASFLQRMLDRERLARLQIAHDDLGVGVLCFQEYRALAGGRRVAAVGPWLAVDGDLKLGAGLLAHPV
jgi:hypothetical protein